MSKFMLRINLMRLPLKKAFAFKYSPEVFLNISYVCLYVQIAWIIDYFRNSLYIDETC